MSDMAGSSQVEIRSIAPQESQQAQIVRKTFPWALWQFKYVAVLRKKLCMHPAPGQNFAERADRHAPVGGVLVVSDIVGCAFQAIVITDSR